MPLLFDVESPVNCETCKQPAVRRTLRVKNGGAVSFDTHSACVTDNEWYAAVSRMNTFYDKLLKFMEGFKTLSDEQKKLTFGTILRFDFETVHPDACTHRSQVRLIADVRAFGLGVEVKTAPRSLKGLRLASVMKELLPLASSASEELKKRFEQGRF